MNCALCGMRPAIETGHVIPKMVYRYLIKTTPTRFLRTTENPNVRVQDGKKFPFLCQPCEDKLGGWETQFARHVFHPIHRHGIFDRRKPFSYRDWLLRFAVSVSWRSLFDLMTESASSESLPHGDAPRARDALETWRQYLLKSCVNA